MSLLNPLAGAIMGGAQAQRQFEIDKDRQLRQTDARRRNIAAENDRLEHEVESADRVSEINEQKPRDEPPPRHLNQPRQNDAEQDASDGLDVTA